MLHKVALLCVSFISGMQARKRSRRSHPSGRQSKNGAFGLAFEVRQHGDAEFSTAQSIPTLVWARVRAQASDHRQSSCALTLLAVPALAG